MDAEALIAHDPFQHIEQQQRQDRGSNQQAPEAGAKLAAELQGQAGDTEGVEHVAQYQQPGGSQVQVQGAAVDRKDLQQGERKAEHQQAQLHIAQQRQILIHKGQQLQGAGSLQRGRRFCFWLGRRPGRRLRFGLGRRLRRGSRGLGL